jgi:hypothetical protein
MARLGFEPRITVRSLHADRFRMRSPAPSKRVFRKPLEAEDHQPDAQPNDGCGAKRESDHHADHMSLPAHVWPKPTTSGGAWSPNFKLLTIRKAGTRYNPPSRPAFASGPMAIAPGPEKPVPTMGPGFRTVRYSRLVSNGCGTRVIGQPEREAEARKDQWGSKR